MAKTVQKYYVVWEGRKPGVFSTWAACQEQINGFNEAKYKSFPTLELAEKAFKEHYAKHIYKKNEEKLLFDKTHIESSIPIHNSISVDAACDVTKGIMEYRGVFTGDKRILFAKGPYKGATNNIGEFLAIVHALAYCKKNNILLPIYTDSMTALAWIKKRKANTKQEANELNTEIFDLIERAENWLKNNTFNNKLLKWNTASWGEIPADYGRK